MRNIYILGDIHGSIKPIRDFYTLLNSSFNENKRPSAEDLLILVGDAGVNFYLDGRDITFKKKLGKYKFTYLIIRGNHEERASNIADNTNWHYEAFGDNGEVLVENNFPYIKYAKDDPSCLTINGKNILILPGAYSVDKYYRLQNNWSWFQDEQLTEEEMYKGEVLAREKKHWDLILSHTCPLSFQPVDLFISAVDQSTVDNTMERWMESFERDINYDLWCWGHYHANRVYPFIDGKVRVMLFNDMAINVNTFFKEHNIHQSLIKINSYATLV